MITSDNKCSRCTGAKCCTYVTEALGAAPRSKNDFDQLLWQVSHQGTEIYKDSSGWYLLFHGRCQHLLADGGCAIYQDRPQICRDYDNAWCEYDAPAEEGFEFHFRNYDELLTYCRKRFKRWDKSRTEGRGKTGPRIKTGPRAKEKQDLGKEKLKIEASLNPDP